MSRRLIAVALLAALLTLAGCAARKPPRTPSDARFEEAGQASWYGRKFHGRLTASGERYDMHAMTAAHPTLPFGTIVEVTNRKNGKQVRVRITDRGPFIKGRIIDLSKEAAIRLDMIRDGVVPVLIRQVDRL
jgi:rare lipoprotein A